MLAMGDATQLQGATMIIFSRRRSALFRQVIAVGLVVVLISHSGCVAYRWKAVPITEVHLEQAKLAGREIRIHMDPGVVGMKLDQIAFPHVMGRATITNGGIVEVDLTQVNHVELVDLDRRNRVLRSRSLPLEDVQQNPEMLMNNDVRFGMDRRSTVLRSVTRVDVPHVEGVIVRGDGPIRVDLRRAQVLEVREVDTGGTILRIVGITSAVIAVTVLLVLLTKESCPIVYIDRGNGWEIVGEAYAGAAFRSIQRDDLLPLPELGGSDHVQVRLRNEARETQYTDQVKLVLIDHSSEIRALSTFDNRIALVGAAAPPQVAWDRRVGDVTQIVAERDDRLWETDPDMVAIAADHDLEDVLIAEFEFMEGRPVLELIAANTKWLDLVFGRFFAAMGGRLDRYLAAGNEPAAGSSIQRWREREGVDLIVEAQVGDEWQQVAVVPTAGPIALREIAIPLPSAAVSPDGLVRVRMRAGLGFWRIDRLALSEEVNAIPTVHEIEPYAAVGSDGKDERKTILATDDRYNVLVEWGETLDLSFELPALAPELARSAFLFTNGYYNVHPPIQSRWQPGVLRKISDERGALARFGRDLARHYAQVLESAPPLHVIPKEGGR
jgi:hypothetical protein